MQHESQNLDSLVDTMSCVVGILVVILATTVIHFGAAIQPPEQSAFAPEILQQTEEQARRLRQLLAQLRERWDGTGVTDLERERRLLQEVQSLIADFEREIETPLPGDADPASLAETITLRSNDVHGLERQIVEASRELESLKVGLEEEPAGPSPSQVVHLPNPRPAPDQSEPFLIFCRYGRLFLFEDQVGEVLQRGLELALADTSSIGPSDTAALDRLSEYFERRSVGYGGFRWRIRSAGRASSLRLEIAKKDSGENLEEITRPNSKYRRRLTALEREKSRHLRFFVWSDSFDVYILARRVAATDFNLDAGWIAYDPSEDFEQNLFVTGSGGGSMID